VFTPCLYATVKVQAHTKAVGLQVKSILHTVVQYVRMNQAEQYHPGAANFRVPGFF
jgi:hypothetical protein